jgi:hypothetical protein
VVKSYVTELYTFGIYLSAGTPSAYIQGEEKPLGGQHASTITPRDSKTISAKGHRSGRHVCCALVLYSRTKQCRAHLIPGIPLFIRLGVYLWPRHLAQDATFAHATLCPQTIYLGPESIQPSSN